MALLFVAGSVVLVGCGGGNGQESDDAGTQADTAAMAESDTAAAASSGTEAAEENEPVQGVTVYQGAPVRKTAGSEGEYVTSLNVGETFTFLRETKEAERGGETKEYSKVRLKGGDEGWVRSDMIATDAKPAAILSETVLHERPTPMASTDNYFKAMDVVAVTDTQDAWVKVKGMRRGENWWDTGWVQPDALTSEQMDVAVSGLWKKAQGEADSTKRREAIKQITENAALEGSVFIDSLKTRLNKGSS